MTGWPTTLDQQAAPDRQAAFDRTAVLDRKAALIAAAQEGDPEAFNQLVKDTYAATYSLAYQLTGNPDDANDVAQDTYLRAFRAVTRFRGDSGFGTWLHRITINSAHTLRHKRRRSAAVSLDDHRVVLHVVDTNPETDPAARAVASDLKDRLRLSLAGLPAFMRQVVELREVEGLTHSAIAERLGISEAAAKVRLHRARQRLRDELDVDRSDVIHSGVAQLESQRQEPREVPREEPAA